MSHNRSGPLVAILLAARFLAELALFAAPIVIGAASGAGVVGVVVGLVASASVVTLWGLALSPRRRLEAPLAKRVALELILFGTAAVALAMVGLRLWALALVTLELVSLLSLAALGLAPGADVSDGPSTGQDTPAP
jgi:hypothetical protein